MAKGKSMFSKIMKKTGKMTTLSHDLLHNQFVLYFIFIIAVANLFHFVFANDIMSVGTFIATGLLTSFFSKNMIVIMVISIVVTHVIRIGNGNTRDGFKSKKSDEDDEDDKEVDEDLVQEITDIIEEDIEKKEEEEEEDQEKEKEVEEEVEEKDQEPFRPWNTNRNNITANKGEIESIKTGMGIIVNQVSKNKQSSDANKTEIAKLDKKNTYNIKVN
jgi:hypothetical protein